MTIDLKDRLSEQLHADAARMVPDDMVPPRLPQRARGGAVSRFVIDPRWRAPALAALAVVVIAAAATIAVTRWRDGTAVPAAGPAGAVTSATPAPPRTMDPHLSQIFDRPAAPFDCMGTRTTRAADAQGPVIGITPSTFCISVLPQSHQVAGTDLSGAGPLRALVIAGTMAAGAVDSSIDGVQWVPQHGKPSGGDPAGTAVDLYSLGSLRGFAFPVSSGGALVLYSGQTVVTRQPVLSPVVGGVASAASSSPAALGGGNPVPAGSNGAASAQPSYPPGEGPSPKPGAWPTNARGQTYGSAGNANAQTGQPDLVAAVATNGKDGYVLATELSGPLPTSLSQAIAQNSAPSRTIPVYESDGVTQIGVFVVTGT